MNDPVKIATQIFFRLLALIILLWLIINTRDYLILLFGATVIALALDPLVSRFTHPHLPRGIAATLVVLGILLIFTGLIAVMVPLVLNQAQELIKDLPLLLEKSLETILFWSGQGLNQQLDTFLQQFTAQISQSLVNTSGGLIRVGQSVFSGLVSLGTFLVVLLYLLIELPHLIKGLERLVSPEKRPWFRGKIKELKERLGYWVHGQIILMIIVGSLTGVGLSILQIPFALPLGVLAGLLEVIPMIGPVVAMLPSLIVALALSPWKALSVLVLYFLIQQVENTLIVPKVMHRSVGLDPLIIITVLTLGGKFFGFGGLLLSIPATLVAWTLLEDYLPSADPSESDDQ